MPSKGGDLEGQFPAGGGGEKVMLAVIFPDKASNSDGASRRLLSEKRQLNMSKNPTTYRRIGGKTK